MKLVVSILLFVLIAGSSCDILSYKYIPPAPSIDEINSETIQSKIDSILNSQLSTNYIPYSFSKLKTIKPVQFLKLDSIYKLRTLLKNNEPNYNSDLEQYNKEIAVLKKEINEQKLFHTYEIEHIYIAKKDEDCQLHEDLFIFLPNFKLKELRQKLSTTLTTSEKDLFDYYSFQNPLFESDDYSHNVEMDNLVYQKFNLALANEQANKAGLLHTILYCIEYIRKYNDFNEQKIAEGIAEKWILKNGYSDYKSDFNSLKKIKKDEQISSYLLESKNKNGSEKIDFTFDLNLVITNTLLK